MSESTTSIAVFLVAAASLLGFLASFGGQMIDVSRITWTLLFPCVLAVILAVSIGIVRTIWSLSRS